MGDRQRLMEDGRTVHTETPKRDWNAVCVKKLREFEDMVESSLHNTQFVGKHGTWRPPKDYNLAYPASKEPPVLGAAFSPSRELFATVSEKGIAKIWIPGGRVEGGQPVSSLPWGVLEELDHRTERQKFKCDLTGACAFAHPTWNGERLTYLAVGAIDGTCFIWQEEDFGGGANISASSRLGNTDENWHAPEWREEDRLGRRQHDASAGERLPGHNSAVCGCCFSHLHILATVDLDGTVILWSLYADTNPRKPTWHAIQHAPKLWDVPLQRPLSNKTRKHEIPVTWDGWTAYPGVRCDGDEHCELPDAVSVVDAWYGDITKNRYRDVTDEVRRRYESSERLFYGREFHEPNDGGTNTLNITYRDSKVAPARPGVRACSWRPHGHPLLAVVSQGKCVLWGLGYTAQMVDSQKGLEKLPITPDEEAWKQAIFPLQEISHVDREMQKDVREDLLHGWMVIQELWLGDLACITAGETETVDVSWAPNNELLALAMRHGELGLFGRKTPVKGMEFWELLQVFPPSFGISCCCFVPGGSLHLAVGSSDGHVALWHAPDDWNKSLEEDPERPKAWKMTQSNIEHVGPVLKLGFMPMRNVLGRASDQNGQQGTDNQDLLVSAGPFKTIVWRGSYPASVIRPAKAVELILPLAALLVQSAQKMGLAFGDGLHWNRMYVWPLSSPLRLTLLEVELAGTPAALVWLRWFISIVFACAFVGFLYYSRGIGYRSVVVLGSHFLYIPVVKSLASPWTWDTAKMGIAHPVLQFIIAVLSVVVQAAYLLCLVPSILQVPSQLWLTPKDWRQTIEDKARGIHLGKMRPGFHGMINSLFSLAVGVVLAQLSLLPEHYWWMKGGLCLVIVAGHIAVDVFFPPFSDAALNTAVLGLHVMIVWLFFCAMVSAGLPMVAPVLLYIGVMVIAIGIMWKVREADEAQEQVLASATT